MTETDDKVELTVRITVKLRPDEYDELSRHVRPDRLVHERIFTRKRGKGHQGVATGLAGSSSLARERNSA
jgi:hypothetical protein